MTRIFQHATKLAAALLAAFGLLVVGAAAPGVASTTAPKQSARPIENLATERCLDDSFEFGLRTLECNGSDYQNWIRHGNEAAWQNVATGRCLDDHFDFGLRPYECNGSVHQEWYGTSELRNQATGRCLDDSFEFGLRPFDCNGLNYQHWLFL